MNLSDVKELSAVAALIFISVFNIISLSPALRDLSHTLGRLTGIIERLENK